MQPTKVYLRAFEPDDYKKINAWRRNEELYRLTTGNRYFVSSERDRRWVLEKIDDQATLYFAICVSEDHTMIGYASLAEIDYKNSHAEWSGIVIGEEQYRGRGYATEATYLLLEYAFDELGMNRVAGTWLVENTVSVFLGKSMGFRTEGILREYVYKNGKRHDVLVMSMLRPEFDRLKELYASDRIGAQEGS
jgi:ribosomal-protein-alanine N-acetyltransferase